MSVERVKRSVSKSRFDFSSLDQRLSSTTDFRVGRFVGRFIGRCVWAIIGHLRLWIGFGSQPQLSDLDVANSDNEASARRSKMIAPWRLAIAAAVVKADRASALLPRSSASR